MYLKYLGSGPSSVLVVIQELPGSAFEFEKGSSGKSMVFRNHSVLAARMYYAFASGLGNLKQNRVLWACARREVHLCSFLRINKAPRELNITDSLAGLFVLIQYYDFLPFPMKSIFTAFFLHLLISSLPSHFYSFLRGGC